MGLDSRELTPAMTQRIVHAASETRSSKRATLVLKHVGGNEVSPSTVQRVTHQVGMEPEVILQVRAAALCDDDRLARYLSTRPGCVHVRRSTVVTAA